MGPSPWIFPKSPRARRNRGPAGHRPPRRIHGQAIGAGDRRSCRRTIPGHRAHGRRPAMAEGPADSVRGPLVAASRAVLVPSRARCRGADPRRNSPWEGTPAARIGPMAPVRQAPTTARPRISSGRRARGMGDPPVARAPIPLHRVPSATPGWETDPVLFLTRRGRCPPRDSPRADRVRDTDRRRADHCRPPRPARPAREQGRRVDRSGVLSDPSGRQPFRSRAARAASGLERDLYHSPAAHSDRVAPARAAPPERLRDRGRRPEPGRVRDIPARTSAPVVRMSCRTWSPLKMAPYRRLRRVAGRSPIPQHPAAPRGPALATERTREEWEPPREPRFRVRTPRKREVFPRPPVTRPTRPRESRVSESVHSAKSDRHRRTDRARPRRIPDSPPIPADSPLPGSRAIPKERPERVHPRVPALGPGLRTHRLRERPAPYSQVARARRPHRMERAGRPPRDPGRSARQRSLHSAHRRRHPHRTLHRARHCLRR